MKDNWRFAIFILLISFLLINSSSFAAEGTKPPKLYSDTSEMEITLSGPWRNIKKNVKL